VEIQADSCLNADILKKNNNDETKKERVKSLSDDT